MSYTQLTYHIIFRTKSNAKTIPDEHSTELYKVIWGFAKNRDCKLRRINGIADHLHLLIDIPAKISIADFVRDLKSSTNVWLKNNRAKFPHFAGWGSQYAAFSVGRSEIEAVFNYVADQREHHRVLSFEEEYRKLIEEMGIVIDEQYWLKD